METTTTTPTMFTDPLADCFITPEGMRHVVEGAADHNDVGLIAAHEWLSQGTLTGGYALDPSVGGLS